MLNAVMFRIFNYRVREVHLTKQQTPSTYFASRQLLFGRYFSFILTRNLEPSLCTACSASSCFVGRRRPARLAADINNILYMVDSMENIQKFADAVQKGL